MRELSDQMTRNRSAKLPARGVAELDDVVEDAFISKLAPDGGSLVYSTYLGGDGNDGARVYANHRRRCHAP